MTIKEAIALCLVMPAILIGCWLLVIRLWRRDVDISGNVTWATGSSSANGVNAAAAPLCLGLTLANVGALLDIAEGRPEATVSDPASWLLGIGTLLVFFSFWMFAFAWPKFLVPPVSRGQRGWVLELIHGEDGESGDRHVGRHERVD